MLKKRIPDARYGMAFGLRTYKNARRNRGSRINPSLLANGRKEIRMAEAVYFSLMKRRTARRSMKLNRISVSAVGIMMKQSGVKQTKIRAPTGCWNPRFRAMRQAKAAVEIPRRMFSIFEPCSPNWANGAERMVYNGLPQESKNNPEYLKAKREIK